MMKTKQKVLIVEDEKVNRNILVRLLRESYEVIEAENGQEAWDLLAVKDCDIAAVLLDLMMPVMDGYGLLDKLRQASKTELPVIVMTGESDAVTEQKALDAGAWDFVSKPYNARVLRSRLRNAIARRQVSAYEKMQRMAAHDPLTGLHNRGRLFATVRQMLEDNPGVSFAFLRIDIDRFALFNSTFGEAEGDKLLCFLAELLREMGRGFARCRYGRVGSDMFGLCMEYPGKQALQAAVDAMQQKLDGYRRDYRLKLSVGVYVIDDPALGPEEFYLRASMGARACKSQYGRNIGYYDAAYGRRAAEEVTITNEMQEALDQGQFVVYFQAKHELVNDEPRGAEALVRWQHPTRGMISPGVFIPVFESNGFIAQLDHNVWEQTCQKLRAWLDAGANPYPVSVNVSRVSLYNPQLVDVLVQLVHKYEIPPALLQLEVTESAYMTNPDLMRQTIHALRVAGFTILMDDFGSGFSSLNTLKEIEVDILKIDMKFLPVSGEAEKSEIILASIIRMANWLGMSVVVEGVETRAQRDFLEGVGCDCVQGYYYARPIPAAEYEEKYVFAEARTQAPAAPAEAPQHNVTVLVIDDSELDRAILSEYLSRQYHVQLCASAEEGLSYLRRNQNRVRLILVDNVMPGMSGMDFLTYCRESATLGGIPTIMITANGNTEDQVKAFKGGAYDYITKPLVREIVLARVQHVMNVSSQFRLRELTEENHHSPAERDSATGLLNKAAFRELSVRMITDFPEELRALLIFDCDDFKGVNDRYGHLTGDALLRCLAGEITREFRKTDLMGRFGGDEFVVLMTGLPGREIARKKAEELIKAAAVACAKEMGMPIGLSAGIAFGERDEPFDAVFSRADQALYEAKNTGRGRAVVYGEKVPPVQDDDKPLVLICSEDPQLYPAIALAYGEGAAFANITSFADLERVFARYAPRIRAICLDMQKKSMEDSDAFYQYLVAQGGGTRIPILAVCREGDVAHIRAAVELDIQDLLALPPQLDVIQRRLTRAIMAGCV